MFRRLNIQTQSFIISGRITLIAFMMLTGCATAPPIKLDAILNSERCKIVDVQLVTKVQMLTQLTFEKAGKQRENCTSYLTNGDKTLLAVTVRFTDIAPFSLSSNTFQVVNGTGTVVWGKKGDPLLCRRPLIAGQFHCPWARGDDSTTELFLGDNWYWDKMNSFIQCTVLMSIPAGKLKGSAIIIRGYLLNLPDDYVLIGKLDDHVSK